MTDVGALASSSDDCGDNGASSVNDGIIACFVRGVKLIQYRVDRIADVTTSSHSQQQQQQQLAVTSRPSQL